jgi:hypothetical protein
LLFRIELQGADEFFPLMLYVLLHARVPRLHRTLLFMQHFARDEEAAGEVGYYFFTLQGAASFALDASPALYAPPPSSLS